ncbi:bilirubin reductase [Murimonas intestini]|uniref:2,4-dienoyl-CoA reductase-like NADH-dependent reductase (Old Yellow Enzyme family) n=1 Tax=Murimonas intestini TaxID=1337051 RepID=A0AB73T0Y1_9FIRM|nr:bilirubin reductase [Murimonas intestini]MCR1840358.1 NADH:flavin oxidoreductase [Murimonas intestini]MCR1867531.1 NADH:flavin oxidoreductase [Murimonas intestini]MCR1884718.1 NADH:flavin oxidoreductase [Murimonas intestini]
MNDKISSPVDYGGIQLKNRIIFAPTTMGLKKDEYLKKLQKIACGGCAMIIIGDVPVGRGGFGQNLFTGKGQEYYRTLTETIHQGDCLACAQLHQSDSNFRSMIKYIPGVLSKKISMEQLRPLLNKEVGPYISEMPEKKIQKIITSFGKAAVQAQTLGFDMVQIHGDRMCGSFSSTVFNHRADKYGGTIQNRARFAVEAVREVRKNLPDIPIDYKLVIRQKNPDYGNAGVLPEELEEFVPMLEEAGVTSFHVTLANHSDLSDTIPPASHPVFGGEGCFLGYCDMVKKYTKLPICGVGGLTSPDFIEQQLSSGRIDCAAMSRQLIADPDWPQKVIENHPEKIRRCIRCNKKCLGGMMEHTGVHCIYEKGMLK